MNIQELRQLLHQDCATVVFKKKDGSVRELFCTTMPSVLGDYESTSKPSDSIVTAWDLENEGWRSFKFDSLISVYTDEFEYVAGSH
jgi:hypothetical protein